MPAGVVTTDKKVRLDKWLWAARFFKTRGLATEAIKGGKIELNGSRAKPSRELKVGDELQIRQGFEEKAVIVRNLSDRRGPAAVARQLYEETVESIAQREKATEQRRLANAHREPGQGRPTKRARRLIHGFTGK
ncbi:MAG TPA: RNA-binding S4 domain-containing protein [Gammaproteobacteria bacterium]|nr:RNA-binding S4 domain-containing protein [Gammaproteobacteria bacterium]